MRPATIFRPGLALAALFALVALGASPAAAIKEFYKMSTIQPGSTPYVVCTTFAQMGKKYAGIDIQVNATGAATRHAVDAARGKIDFYMSAPVVTQFMQQKAAMYRNLDEAPELVKNLRGIFNFPIGIYQMVVYADSGIETLRDIKGKKVFLGPPTGAARRVAAGIVEGATGYKENKDYESSKLGFAAAAQAFQDRQLDLIFRVTNVPGSFISQIALTNKIRILSLTEQDFKNPALQAIMRLPGRTIAQVPVGAYGKNQVNTEPATSVGAWVGVGTHKGVDDEAVYRLTKAFFEHLPEVHAQAVWMNLINLDMVFREMNMPLHPGAVRYYREKGLSVPSELVP